MLARAAAGLAVVVSLTTPSLVRAADLDACSDYLDAQNYPRAQVEAEALLKGNNLSREDELLVRHCLGDALTSLGRWRDALPNFLRMEAISQSTEELVDSDRWLGLTYQNLGDFGRGLLYMERANKLRKEAENKKNEAGRLNNLGLIAYERGDQARALTLFGEGLVLQPDNPSILSNIALIQDDRKEYAEAVKLTRQALGIVRGHDVHQEALIQINLGRILTHKGDLANAEIELTAGLKWVQMNEDKHWESRAYQNFGELYFAQHRLAEAKAMTRKAIAIAKANGMVNESAVVYLKFLNKQ